MSSEHLVGTSIPRFTFDTPTTPGNDFYALCAGTGYIDRIAYSVYYTAAGTVV